MSLDVAGDDSLGRVWQGEGRRVFGGVFLRWSKRTVRWELCDRVKAWWLSRGALNVVKDDRSLAGCDRAKAGVGKAATWITSGEKKTSFRVSRRVPTSGN